VDPRVFLAVELPDILPTEMNFIDSLLVHPQIATIALDFIGFERRFLSDIALLRSALESSVTTHPELASSLLPVLDDITTAHQAFLGRLESVVSLHTPGFVIEFIDHLAHVAPIFRAHHAYILQVLIIENFINAFCLTCAALVRERLNGRLLIHFFKLPIAWQNYASAASVSLLALMPPEVDPYLCDGLHDFKRTNDHLTASIDSIPKLEQISKLFLIEPFPIAVSGRRFIRQGRAWKQCRKAITERELLLFSDIFMYVQPKGGKYMVPASYKLAFLRVVPSSYNGRVSLDIYAPMKSFILQFAEEHERDAWNAAFQDAIANARAQTRVPPYKEAPIWIPDILSDKCMLCGITLTFFRRRHHCRNCGKIMCTGCLPARMILGHISETRKSKVCRTCVRELAGQAGTRVPTREDEEELRRAVTIVRSPEAAPDESSGQFPSSSDEEEQTKGGGHEEPIEAAELPEDEAV
jgi:hypothetical protein